MGDNEDNDDKDDKDNDDKDNDDKDNDNDNNDNDNNDNDNNDNTESITTTATPPPIQGFWSLLISLISEVDSLISEVDSLISEVDSLSSDMDSLSSDMDSLSSEIDILDFEENHDPISAWSADDVRDGWKSALCHCFVGLDNRWKNAELGKNPLKRDFSGSTAACVILQPGINPLLTLGVGDSQIIGFKREGGEAVLLCEMHRPSVEEESKRIEAAGGSILERSKSRKVARVQFPGTESAQFGLAVSRAFGDLPYKEGSFVGHGNKKKS